MDIYTIIYNHKPLATYCFLIKQIRDEYKAQLTPWKDFFTLGWNSFVCCFWNIPITERNCEIWAHIKARVFLQFQLHRYSVDTTSVSLTKFDDIDNHLQNL